MSQLTITMREGAYEYKLRRAGLYIYLCRKNKLVHSSFNTGLRSTTSAPRGGEQRQRARGMVYKDLFYYIYISLYQRCILLYIDIDRSAPSTGDNGASFMSQLTITMREGASAAASSAVAGKRSITRRGDLMNACVSILGLK